MRKNYFKSLMYAALLLAAPFVATSCDDVIGQEDNPVASYVQWKTDADKTEIALTIGKTYTRTATAVSSAIIAYESSNAEVATVDPVSGLVTAKKEGSAEISAVISGMSTAGRSVFQPTKLTYTVKVTDNTAKLARNIDSYVEYTANVDSTFDVSKFFNIYPAKESTVTYKLLGVNTKDGTYGGTNLGTLTGNTFKVGAYLENTKGISDTLYVAAETTGVTSTDYKMPKANPVDTVMIVITKAIAYMNEQNERTILTADKYKDLSVVLSDSKFDGTIKAGTYFVNTYFSWYTSTPKISGDVTFILENNRNQSVTAIDDATDNSTLNFFRQANVKDGDGNNLPVGYFEVWPSSAGNGITNFKAINIYGGRINVYGRGANKGAVVNVGNINVYNDAEFGAYGNSISNNYAYGIKLKDGGKLTVAGGTVNVNTGLNDVENGFAVIGDVEVSKGVFTASNGSYRAVKGNLTAGGKILIKESNDNSTWTKIEGTTSTAKYIKAQETSKTWK